MHFGILRRRQRPQCSTSSIDLTNVTKSPFRRAVGRGIFICIEPFVRQGWHADVGSYLGGGYQFDPMDRVDFGIAQVAVAINSSLALSRSASVIPMLRPC